MAGSNFRSRSAAGAETNEPAQAGEDSPAGRASHQSFRGKEVAGQMRRVSSHAALRSMKFTFVRNRKLTVPVGTIGFR